jgi:hypothetical protein
LDIPAACHAAYALLTEPRPHLFEHLLDTSAHASALRGTGALALRGQVHGRGLHPAHGLHQALLSEAFLKPLLRAAHTAEALLLTPDSLLLELIANEAHGSLRVLVSQADGVSLSGG